MYSTFKNRTGTFQVRIPNASLTMPERVTALNFSKVPLEHPHTPLQDWTSFVDELPIERVQGTENTYFLVTRELFEKLFLIFNIILI
jgi:hypothetical protein